MVKAMEYCSTSVRLKLAGNFSSEQLRDEIIEYKGWGKVDELGFLDREAMSELLANSLAGLVCFFPEPNHINSQPNKIFEYMSAGIPVIGSNFPLWEKIIGQNGCGLCIDSQDPQQIASAIDYFASNPDKAFEMGQNGKKAVMEKYNWKIEEEKLFNIYENLF
jgi:glycosyltransferase involved in cell wall biosynthesis